MGIECKVMNVDCEIGKSGYQRIISAFYSIFLHIFDAQSSVFKKFIWSANLE